MDSAQFDDATRALAPLVTRRGLAGVLGLAALGSVSVADAKRKKRKKRKKKKNKNNGDEVKLNEFGCVNVGDFCENSGQCCSGICENDACQAHDANVCQAGQTDLSCAAQGVNADCTTPGGGDGLCVTTTGNAGFCVGDRKCFACTKDTDCQGAGVCGLDAACIVCANCDETGGTACAGTVAESCP